MIKINTKENVKRKIAKILTIFILITIEVIFLNQNKVNAALSSEIEEKTTTKSMSNYTVDVDDEEVVSDTIKDLILTINSEGMSKSLLSQTLNLYTQLTTQYTNNEIVDMIEQNKSELEQNDVPMDNVNSVITLLKSVDTVQLRKVLSQVDADQIAMKIEDGENIQTIIKDITGDMTTAEKVNFVMDILLSAYVTKIIIIAFIILYI